MTVRANTAASLSGADNDYQPLITDTNGRLHTIEVSADTALSGNEFQVDIVAALPAGTNAIGKLAANSGVDIGDVDVTSLPATPTGSNTIGEVTIGTATTAATDLAKAEDAPHASGDVGIMALGVHTEEATKIDASAEDDYTHLHIGELGGLYVEPEQHNHLNEFDATTGWTALGNDTDNVATTLNHLTGSNALTFDKVDGAADTVLAGIQNTITAVNLGALDLHDVVQSVCYLSSIDDVDYVFIRIGTDSTNYNEWRVADTDLTAGEFIPIAIAIGRASQAGNTGNGVDWTTITYIAVGVAFDAETDTLSGIIFDQLGVFTGTHASTSPSEVGGVANSVKVNKWRNTNVSLNAANVDAGTLRVVLADNQNFVHKEDDAHTTADAGVQMLAVRTASPADKSGADGDYEPLQMDNGRLYTSTELTAGTAAFGKLSANSGVDIGDVDVTSISAGSNLIGDVGLGVRTSGGVTIFRSIDLDESEEEIKATAGQIYWIHAMNLKASTLYLRFYNLTAANTTVGTSAIELTFPLATQGDTNGAGFFASFPQGIPFDTAITCACTTAIADNDTGAPGANECVVNIGFK